MATQSGIYHETYGSDMQLRPTTMQRVRLALVAALLVVIPFVVDSSTQRLVNTVVIASIGAIGLNVLVGFTGQISLGQGAFLAIGAYACGLLQVYFAVPWPIALLAAAFISALLGGLIGLPSLRLKGLYLAVATLAAQQIVEWVIINWDPIDGEINGRATDALRIPGNALFGNADLRLNNNDTLFYVVAAAILVVVAMATTNLFRTHIGRAFVAIRDQDIAAEVMGVNLYRYKVLAFMVSSFIVGIAGGLLALQSTAISFERFTLSVSIEYLAMIIIGGLGTVSGSIYGAAFIVVLPELLRSVGRALAGTDPASLSEFNRVLPFVQEGVFGVVIVVTLIIEPEGIQRIWRTIKDYFRLWPFSY
ncbi:MAG: branched-chain amino acid ABC transporter permease [Chloroflexi bacterium]|nr:branched-chain amino acid ABC transporter permease [Chloroflexota bacterium]